VISLQRYVISLQRFVISLQCFVVFFARVFLYLLLVQHVFSSVCSAACDKNFDKNFIKSFVDHYEFSPEGRYTHEYHPFLLDRTSKSLQILENSLQASGFTVSGRSVIFGYEENAVPSYYTDYKKAMIRDEACVLNDIGWSLRLHNRFGVISGFLFKDIDMFAGKGPSVFKHIDAHTVPLFDDRAIIFQEHAFGEALGLMDDAYMRVMEGVAKHDMHCVLGWLTKFWKILYKDALKVGNNQVAGTQDILFSIAYATHLMNARMPIDSYFIGPDITYPIETFVKQNKEVTRHAQSFVKMFARKLKPVDKKSTAYIFCSYVDGVGKSTMLGNIKNWMKYGDDIDRFEHVDNSSSQLAEVFQFDQNVYIADLPAQVSHFTYKPDGLVYVDVQTEVSSEILRELRTYVCENQEDIIAQFEHDQQTVFDLIKKDGYLCDAFYDTHNPAYAFIKNLFLLKRVHDNRWIAFTHNNTYYLFNRKDSKNIRVMTTLSQVKSEGLKNIESEQMLFFDGIRFPSPYQFFLEDLIAKLKKNHVENIVFVDFLSMYPRSSRENVRINYLLQQMALLDTQFDIAHSAYRNFVSGGELLYYLQNQKTVRNVFTAFELETFVRLILCTLIVDRKAGDITGIDMQALTEHIQKKLKAMGADIREYACSCVQQKIIQERAYLEKLYGLYKSFVNIQQLSFDKICAYSELLQELFTQKIENTRLNGLWDSKGDAIGKPTTLHNGQCDNKYLMTDENNILRLCYSFSPACKSELLLTPFLRMTRANWYASLSNLLYGGQITSYGKLEVHDERFCVPPLLVQKQNDQTVNVLQHTFDSWDGKIPSLDKRLRRLFKLVSKSSYGEFQDKAYRLDWDCQASHTGIFAFDCDCSKKDDMRDMYYGHGSFPIVTKIVQKYQKDHGASKVIPTSELYEKLCDSVSWEQEQKKLERDAHKNGFLPIFGVQSKHAHKKSSKSHASHKTSGNHKISKKQKKKQKSIFLALPEQREGARLLVRLLATLEMIAKDPCADIAVRDGNREDFNAAILLLEKVTLPKYYGILFKDDLFYDYDTVQPYPSWDFWEDLEN